MARIAIVGYGFVGKAVKFGFDNIQNEILIVDPYLGHSKIEESDVFKPDFTFVCVPTPMGDDGSIDANIITEVIRELNEMNSGTIVIKSTVTPDIITSLVRFKRFVYNPEFLTERNAFDEFINPKFHVIGGDKEFTTRLKWLYEYDSNCNPAPIYFMTIQEASLVKYGINSFLAMKVVWFNQWKDMCERAGARYGVVSNAIGNDNRIGHSHMTVPGFDGKKGFGGSCFPKDTAAIQNYGSVDLHILKAVIESNNVYRNEYELDDREQAQKVRFK